MSKKENIFQTKLNGSELIFDVGSLAEQASGSTLVRFGETTVLVTAQIGQNRPEMGFFPLSCEFEEKHYAAGKILGSRFVRREGRPTTEATLSARMIDRTIRPLFPEGMTNEIQVIATCLSWDGENDPDVFGILGASLALSVSEIPWSGPIGAVRIGRIDNKLLINPTYEQREKSELDLVLAGQEKDGHILINMIDGRASQVSEAVLEEVFQFAQGPIKELIGLQKKISEKTGKTKLVLAKPVLDKKMEAEVKKILTDKLDKALYAQNKAEHKAGLAELEEEIKQAVLTDFSEDKLSQALALLEKTVDKTLKENILKKEKRPDGRKLDQVRDLDVKVALLPRTHGSGLFQRGQTKVLSILTLGSPGDRLLQETMEASTKKQFMLHYNFPPYSVGEVKRLGSPGRREIGHGMLAEKALLPLLPDSEKFPYTIRVVSEVVSSNGSSSMASISASCLALMDAGVPISAPAAGIACGLVRGENGEFKILTDIQGPEDHYGEMDLKAAGTGQGVTVLQMDVKGDGITLDIFQAALEQAKKARLTILAEQNKALSKPRAELSPYAPRIYTLQINPSKIGAVIGTGGKIINQIIDECEVQIDIEDSGQVFVSAEKEENAQKALDWIKGLTKEIKVGEVFQGVVKSVVDFGAFVEIAPGQEGLVHISRFAPFHINKVEDVVKLGDKIPVKVISIDDFGKIALSAKEAGFQPPPSLEGRQPESMKKRPFSRGGSGYGKRRPLSR